MGNKQSSVIPPSKGEKPDFLAEFYGKEKSEEEICRTAAEYYHKCAERLFQQVNDPKNDLFLDLRKGISLPYLSSNYHPSLASERDPFLGSENLRYVEIVFCQDDGCEIKEKFAIHQGFPEHECRDCECLKKMLEISSERGQVRIRELPYSPTSSDPIRPLMRGGAQDNDDDEESTTTSEPSPTSPETKKGKKKEKREEKKEDVEIEEDNDLAELEEELEGIEEEEITEDGLLMSQSDISSDDLYRMQRRIFESETETDELTSDQDLEREVKRAMKEIKRPGTIFSSEEREIMDMNSSSDQYLRRPTNKNKKYS